MAINGRAGEQNTLFSKIYPIVPVGSINISIALSSKPRKSNAFPARVFLVSNMQAYSN